MLVVFSPIFVAYTNLNNNFPLRFVAPLITARSTLCLRGFISRAKELLKRMKQEDSKRTTRGTFYEKEH